MKENNMDMARLTAVVRHAARKLRHKVLRGRETGGSRPRAHEILNNKCGIRAVRWYILLVRYDGVEVLGR